MKSFYEDSEKVMKEHYHNKTARPLGVFLIRNTKSNRVFLAAGIDLPGTINRHKFQLTNGIHSNRALQDDWNTLGSGKFAFEIIEELQPRKDAAFDARRELEFMEEMWLEKLRPFGERGYNEKRLSRAEKLGRMAKSQELRGKS